jgi:signal peptidase I
MTGGEHSRRRRSWLTEVALVVVVTLVVAALIRAFVAQVFFIPSGSMEDTLDRGDWILVSKLSTEFGDPDPGDVVVFADPGGWLEPSRASSNPIRQLMEFVGLAPDSAEGDLVKRVIGTGGDHVSCCDTAGRVRVNGAPLDETYLFPGNSPGAAPAGCSGEFDVTVPAGYLWVMGDHRAVSSDSRCQQDMSRFVPEDLVRGRAVAVIWPVPHWDLLQRPATFEATAAALPARRDLLTGGPH